MSTNYKDQAVGEIDSMEIRKCAKIIEEIQGLIPDDEQSDEEKDADEMFKTHRLLVVTLTGHIFSFDIS